MDDAQDHADILNGGRVRWSRDGLVAVLTVVNPPVNALVHPVRLGLLEGLARAEADPDIDAVVIAAEGRTFPAGADVHEFGGPSAEPSLAALCARIENSPIPVIAAIHGTALGGGFELALACHVRVADRAARFGFPEVTLGLVPAAGGTQRLPRIAGADGAFEILLSGKPISVDRAAAFKLVDKVANKNLLQVAVQTAASTPSAQRTCDRFEGLSNPTDFLASVANTREKFKRDRRPAIGRIILLVEAALLLPFDIGIGMEQSAYEELVRSDTAQALRHAFLAERRAGRRPMASAARARPISLLGIVGAGPLARELAIAGLGAGVPVMLALEEDQAASRARRRIETRMGQMVEAGRLSASDRDKHLSRLTVSRHFGALSEADFVIEALPDNAVRKANTLSQLSDVLGEGVPLASSAAASDIGTLASASRRAGQFLVMHFISPADRTRLVEFSPTRDTSPEVEATALRLARAMGKAPVYVRPTQGLAFTPLMRAYYTAAALCVEQGAMPADVDAAMRAFGLPVGPFQAQDRAGLDAVWGTNTHDAPTELTAKMLEHAWFGARTGQGFYRYEEGRGGRAAPEVIAMVRDLRAEHGLIAQNFTAEDLRNRCLFAVANEGLRLLASKVVRQASDIDASFLAGIGFPRDKGGPMFAADLKGALSVRNALRSWAAEDPFWTPHVGWDDYIKFGKSVTSSLEV